MSFGEIDGYRSHSECVKENIRPISMLGARWKHVGGIVAQVQVESVSLIVGLFISLPFFFLSVR